MELEGVCEALSLLLDKKQAFYRHSVSRTAGAGSVIPGVEGTELLSMLSEEDWRARVGFADWVSAAARVNVMQEYNMTQYRRSIFYLEGCAKIEATVTCPTGRH